MDLLKNKLSDLTEIIQYFEEYNDMLKPLIENLDEFNSSFINKTITTLEKKVKDTIAFIDKNTTSDNLEVLIKDIFNKYGRTQELFTMVDNLIEYLNKNHIQPENIYGSDLSETYKLSTGTALRTLMSKYTLFKNKHEANEKPIIAKLHNVISNAVIKEFKDKKSVKKTIQYIRDQFYKNKNTITLYSNILQKLLDYVYYDTDMHKSIYDIMKIIEDDKDMFLDGSISNTFNKTINKTLHIINPPLKRFGLLPVSNSMPLKDIIPYISKGSASGKKLETYAKQQNICFIVLHRVVYQPTEYNIRKLINRDEAREYIQPKEYGLTTKLIKRFENIKQPPYKSNRKWDFSYKIIGKMDTNMFYIIESLDGETYRFMAPWNDNSNIILNKHRVTHILKYFTNPNKPNRIVNYHTQCIKKSVPNMFLRRKLDLDIMADEKKNVDIHHVKNTLFLHLIKIIKTSIGTGSGIKSDSDVNDVIHNPELKKVFISVLMKMYEVMGFNKKSDASNFQFHETFTTFLVDLDKAAIRFMKNLHDGYNREPLNPSVFKEKLTSKKNKIYTYIETLVNKIINTIINNNDNIYNNINYKDMLLNFY
jgi:hypothetical protein